MNKFLNQIKSQIKALFRAKPVQAVEPKPPKSERVKYAGMIKFVFILISVAANVDLVLQLKSLKVVEIIEFSFKLSMIEFIALASLQTALSTHFGMRMYAMLTLFVFDVLFMGIGWYFKAEYMFGENQEAVLLSYVGGLSIVASIGSFVAYFLISALTNADRNYKIFETNMARIEKKNALKKAWRDVSAFDYRVWWGRFKPGPNLFARMLYRVAFWAKSLAQFRTLFRIAEEDVQDFYHDLTVRKIRAKSPVISSDGATISPDDVKITATRASVRPSRATVHDLNAVRATSREAVLESRATDTETAQKWVCASCGSPTKEGYVWCTSSDKRACAMAVDNALARKAKAAMTENDVRVLEGCYGDKFREKAKKHGIE